MQLYNKFEHIHSCEKSPKYLLAYVYACACDFQIKSTAYNGQLFSPATGHFNKIIFVI